MAQPVKSMTGFAAVTRDAPGGRVTIELKSVNHRYLEFQTRMPEEIRSLEGAMREQLALVLTRGKVDCRVTLTNDPGQGAIKPSPDALSALLVTQSEILAAFEARPLSVWEIMHAPGVLPASEMTPEILKEPLLALFAEAISELDATRAREGEKLAKMLVERLDGIDQLTKQVAPLVPQMVLAYEEKLKQKMIDADLNTASDDRLKQEVVLFASRIDIAEELNRLGAHTTEVRRVLKG
ncbi:MAG: YicC/YloC family endoribonuclease, partial [Pseudomonadota bacterium]